MPGSGSKRPLLFVSHHHSEASAAHALATALADVGVDCWISSKDISVGSTYDQRILEAIQRADGLLLLLSARSDRSRHVWRELDYAIAGEKRTLPVKLEPMEPSQGGLAYLLRPFQFIEWFDHAVGGGERIARQIVESMEGEPARKQPPQSEPTPSPPSPPAAVVRDSRGTRRVLGLIGVVALAAVLAVYWFLQRPPPFHNAGKVSAQRTEIQLEDVESVLLAGGPGDACEMTTEDVRGFVTKTTRIACHVDGKLTEIPLPYGDCVMRGKDDQAVLLKNGILLAACPDIGAVYARSVRGSGPWRSVAKLTPTSEWFVSDETPTPEGVLFFAIGDQVGRALYADGAGVGVTPVCIDMNRTPCSSADTLIASESYRDTEIRDGFAYTSMDLDNAVALYRVSLKTKAVQRIEAPKLGAGFDGDQRDGPELRRYGFGIVKFGLVARVPTLAIWRQSSGATTMLPLILQNEGKSAENSVKLVGIDPARCLIMVSYQNTDSSSRWHDYYLTGLFSLKTGKLARMLYVSKNSQGLVQWSGDYVHFTALTKPRLEQFRIKGDAC